MLTVVCTHVLVDFHVQVSSNLDDSCNCFVKQQCEDLFSFSEDSVALPGKKTTSHSGPASLMRLMFFLQGASMAIPGMVASSLLLQRHLGMRVAFDVVGGNYAWIF